MKKNLDRKNKILALSLGVIILGSVFMAILWFTTYAPIIMNR